MNKIVIVNNGVAMTSSLLIAELFDRPHDNVLKSLDKLVDSVGFNAISYIDSMNRPKRAYELTERQALIAMPFIGGLKSVDGQVMLVDAFLALRDAQKQPDTTQARLDSMERELKALKIDASLPKPLKLTHDRIIIESLKEAANNGFGLVDHQLFSKASKFNNKMKTRLILENLVSSGFVAMQHIRLYEQGKGVDVYFWRK